MPESEAESHLSHNLDKISLVSLRDIDFYPSPTFGDIDVPDWDPHDSRLMDESFYEDPYDGLHHSAPYTDREIDEWYDRMIEDEEWENQVRGLDLHEAYQAFWEAFQEQKFPPQRHGRKSRVKYH